MIQPSKKDRVVVTDGAHAGVKGVLMHIDGTDTFVLASLEEIRVVNFAHLAKITNDV